MIIISFRNRMEINNEEDDMEILHDHDKIDDEVKRSR